MSTYEGLNDETSDDEPTELEIQVEEAQEEELNEGPTSEEIIDCFGRTRTPAQIKARDEYRTECYVTLLKWFVGLFIAAGILTGFILLVFKEKDAPKTACCSVREAIGIALLALFLFPFAVALLLAWVYAFIRCFAVCWETIHPLF